VRKERKSLQLTLDQKEAENLKIMEETDAAK